MTISVPIPADDKGFVDKECPNKECLSQFKIHQEDWRDKVSDDCVYCPFCRYEAEAKKWFTQEQVEYVRKKAVQEAARAFQGALARGVAKSRPVTFGGRGSLLRGSMSLSFRPRQIPDVLPLEAVESFIQEFQCETCNCRFSSVGASFFCPACGNNSALESFEGTIRTVLGAVSSLPEAMSALEGSVGKDTARDIARQLMEDQYPRLVGAFEKVSLALIRKLSNPPSVNNSSVFQRLQDGSVLWKNATGIGYDGILSSQELEFLTIHFQRRHVFSHAQGVIDQTYLTRSGDQDYQVGQRLVVSGAEVEQLARILRKLVAGLKALL